MKGTPRGFSYIEILVTLLVLSIILGYAGLNFSSFSKAGKLRHLKGITQNSLHNFRNLTLIHGNIGVFIEPTSKIFLAYHDKDNSFTYSPGVDRILDSVHISEPWATITLDSGTFKETIFYPSGSLSQSIYLRLGIGSDSSRWSGLRMLAATGRIQEYGP